MFRPTVEEITTDNFSQVMARYQEVSFMAVTVARDLEQLEEQARNLPGRSSGTSRHWSTKAQESMNSAYGHLKVVMDALRDQAHDLRTERSYLEILIQNFGKTL